MTTLPEHYLRDDMSKTYQYHNRNDGIAIYRFHNRDVAWEHIYEHTTKEYDNKPTKYDNVYYCMSCGIVFVMPAWYTDYYIGSKANPMKILQKYIKCCKRPMIFIRIPEDSLTQIRSVHKIGPYKGMIFEPPSPSIIWHISDQWINTSIVVDELL